MPSDSAQTLNQSNEALNLVKTNDLIGLPLVGNDSHQIFSKQNLDIAD